MDNLDTWSEIPEDKLGEFDYGVKHDDDASLAVGYTHADPGYVVWATEGKLHEGGPQARLDYHENKGDAKQQISNYARNHTDPMKARQAVRGTGDAAKGVANPEGMTESLPYSISNTGVVRKRLQNHFESAEELANATDGHLASFEGVGPTTIQNIREWAADEGYIEYEDKAEAPDDEVDLGFEPSGLELSDPATEITGIGDSSLAADETVGEFWERGCPFQEVAPAWQEEALKDILGATFFHNTQASHIIRVFSGYTAAYAYDEHGEELWNFAEAMFGQFDWDKVRWAWADHGPYSDFADNAAGQDVIEEQAAIATGDELPVWELDFDPEEDTGLSGLHETTDVEKVSKKDQIAVRYTADVPDENNTAYAPYETVSLYSLLFNTDYTDPSNANLVQLVVDTSTDDESKERTALDSDPNQFERYVVVFKHPSADLYGLAEGRITIKPSDFDLEEPSEFNAWAAKVAEQVEERNEAFEREMRRTPDTLREVRGVAPKKQLDDATGVTTLDEDDTHPDDRERPDREEVWEEQMESVYDPAREFDENVQAAESAGALDDDDDPAGGPEEFKASYHHRADVPEEIGDWTLTEQESEGRPVYSKNGRTLRVKRDHRTDVVHRRYAVELREAEENEAGIRPSETLADGQSPEEAMDVLEEAALERSGDAGQGGDVYDPTDEFEELEDPSEILGIGEGRRKTLDALDEKDQLDDPQSFDSLEEMVNAVREISLAHRDGRTYMAPPEKAIQAIESTYESLPEEARQAFLNDHRLYVKIRAARNRFNDWMGKQRRRDKIPSTMEAGPSNYPSKKANETAEYAREAKEELKEAIGKIRSAANGAEQRALKSIGSSVGERNEQQREQKREDRREAFEKGDLAFWSDTKYGNALWGVKRVNKKSVRLRRPHGSAGMEKPMSDGETYPEYDETRADLDSNRLKGPIPADEIAEFAVEDTDARMSDDAIAVRADTADEARRIVFGDEWVEENLDLSDGVDTDEMDQPVQDEFVADDVTPATVENIMAEFPDVTKTQAEALSELSSVENILVSKPDQLTKYKGVGDGTIARLTGNRPWNANETIEEQRTTDSNDEEDGKAYFIVSQDGAGSGIRGTYYDRSEAEADMAEMPGDWEIQTEEDTRLKGDPEVGNYLWVDYEDGGGFAGTVTRVEDGEALVRVSEGQKPHRLKFDRANRQVVLPKGGVEDVKRVKVDREDAKELEEETKDDPGGPVSMPDEDDLQTALASRGINNIVASNLADQYDSMAAVEEAVSTADNVSDIHGVGDASARQVREAFGLESNQTDTGSESDLPADMDPDEYDGPYKTKRMENAHYWAGQLLGFMKNGPNAGIRGTYFVDIIGGRPVLVMEGDEWHETSVDAIKTELRNWNFPEPLDVKSDGENPQIWIREPSDDRLTGAAPHPDWREFEANGGYADDPEARFRADQLEWDQPKPRKYQDDQDDGTQPTTAIDSETGESESFDVPEAVNGWERDDNPGRGAAAWSNPNADEPVDYVHVTKTGPQSYLVQRNTGEKGDYDTENIRTTSDMDEALYEAKYYMRNNPAEGGSDPYDPTGDREVAEEHRQAVEAARDADPEGELPGPALKALKKNWSVYKRGIKEGREAVEEAKEYRDEHRADAEEAAAIINDIRDAYGQEPIDFDGVEGIPEVPELGGKITDESPDVSLSFDWSADPYDPTEEV